MPLQLLFDATLPLESLTRRLRRRRHAPSPSAVDIGLGCVFTRGVRLFLRAPGGVWGDEV